MPVYRVAFDSCVLWGEGKGEANVVVYADLFDAYASMMLSAGEHPMWVAKQMGHADWTMIARVYGRWMPSADVEAGNRAVEKFAGEGIKMLAKKLANPA